MENRIPENQHLSFLAAGFAAFLCVLFGANAVAIKVGLSGIGPFTTAGIRFGLAALVIYTWSRMTGQTLIIKKEQLRPILTLSAIFTVQLSLLYLGISKTSASRGTLLINLQPFFILFIAHYYIPGDQLTKRKLLGLLLGFSGVAFVFLEKKGITSDFRIGDSILVAVAFLWACNGVYTKKLIVDFHPYQLIFYPMVISVPLFFFQAWIWDEAMFVHINMTVLGALFYQSFVTASFGFMAWTRMLQKHAATALHSFLFIMPISGVVLGGLLLDEPITSKIILALILIAMGIVTIHLKTKIGIPFFHLQKHL
jgi:drug/metabolite transporter (DMT)-like permease